MNIKHFRKVSDRAATEYKAFVGERIDGVGCVYATHLLSNRLESEDFDFDCVLGLASFGINAGRYGICEYGYSVDGAVEALELIAHGKAKMTDLPTFHAHTWVEIGDYVVDLTLLTLKQSLRKIHKANRAQLGPFKLDLKTAPVMHKDRLVSRDHIRGGGIGAHYNALHRLSSHAFVEAI